ncbi:MAG: hypothetical protein L0211_07245, partial [Planctomycetaceae bacterium]|nr:hypothetical protein [Planctomycetaceae bacterium]
TSLVTVAVVDGSSDDAFDPVLDQTVSVTTVDNEGVTFTTVELSGGNLLVTDTGGVNDNLFVSRNGANIRIHDPSNPLSAGAGVTQVGPNTVEVAFAAVTGNLALETQAGDDSVTFLYSGGDPLPAGGALYNGGSQTGSPGDRLTVVGTGVQTATYLPNGAVNAALDNDGIVTVDSRIITFTGLEPVNLIGMAVANVNFPSANDAITLANGLTSGGEAAIVVSGASQGVSFESIALRNNMLVNIDTATSDGIDTISITSANNLHGNTNLNLTTGAGSDTIDVSGPAVFTGTVSLASQQIDFDSPMSQIVAGGVVTLNAGSGAITDGSLGTPSVAATVLSATAATGIRLGTDVGSLTASTTAAGPIQIQEANAIELTSVTAANGSITIDAAGATTVKSVVSTADADANDIRITAAAGNMTVERVTAGAGAAGDVTLEATAGSIFDDLSDATLVTADVFTITAFQAIGVPPAVNPTHIDSKATSLVARITGSPLPLPASPVPGIWITDVDDLVVTSARTNDGVIILRSGGTMTALLVSAAELAGAPLRNVNLSAVNFSVPVGSLLRTTGNVTLNALTGPSTVNFAGDVDAGLLTINGTAAAVGDTFHVRPDQDTADILTPIRVFGMAPVVAPGDVLNLDTVGLGTATLLLGPGANNGQYLFGAAAASVTYNSIETANTGPANVTLDMQLAGFQTGGGDSDEIFVRLDDPGTNLLVDIDGVPFFAGAAASINSLTVIGSADDDRLTVEEINGRLPKFAGRTPLVNNTLIGGGTANPSHLNASADLVLETLAGGPNAWDDSDVTIHFDGRTGVDSIDLILATPHATSYTSDTLDSANSGNLATRIGASVDFLMSFANLAPLNLNGAGGSLLVDATSTPATTNLTISDDGTLADGWSQVAGNGGFETTRFRGYAQLDVVGGNGAELIDQVGFDSDTSLTSAQLRGGNTADFLGLLVGNDAASDTLRIRSTPALTSIVANGDGGDDLVHLEGAANTVDLLLANVAVTGGPLAGNDTLTVVDSGDLTGDTVVITQNTIDGNTGAAGPDINYSNIDILNVTATAASDSLLASFAPVVDLDIVNLSGWTGSDQFSLSTTDEQIGGAATGIQAIRLYGDAPGNPNAGDGNDVFGQSLSALLPGTPVGVVPLIRPSISTLINIDGGRPTANPNLPAGDQAGDELNLDLSALLPPVIVTTLGNLPSQPGVAKSIAVSHRPVNFIEIEDINLVDDGTLTNTQIGDLYVRGSNNVDAVSFLATADPNVARVRINTFQSNITITRRAIVYGRAGNDNLQMGDFNRIAEFYGEEGDDFLAGYLADDKLVGGFGRDRINASQGNNVVWGDRDPVEAGLADNEANRQTIASEAGPGLELLDADILNALDGHDTMYGGPGGDTMTLGGGNDYAYGGQGNDNIGLGAGDDRGYGGAGNDTITGSLGNDLVSGGEGVDSISGDQGLDVLIGGGGNDTVNGGDGDDLLFDGRVTYGGGSDSSQTIGDAHDVAMAALLADWATSGPGSLSSPFTNDHDGTDQLRGDAGSDSFSADAADILDFVLGIDTIL